MKKKKETKKYLYEVEYASGILRSNGRQNIMALSNKKLNEGQFIVVEHIDCGVFIGRIIEEVKENWNLDYVDYRYVQDIDLSNWIDKIEKEKRIEELKLEMEHKFAEIDKKKKFEYYAEIDDDFRELYLEYEELGGGKE